MNNHLIILFVLLPMGAGIATLLLHRWPAIQRAIGGLVLTANVVLAVIALGTVSGWFASGSQDDAGRILVSQMGNWPAPFGITIAVDGLSAIMLAVESIVCLAVFIYCVSQLPHRFSGGYFHPLYHLLMLGVQWSFITGDLFNLFVAFEIMLMASYAMFCVGTTAAQMRQAYKYILLNLVGSTLFVTCAGMLYGQLGTLNMADITRIGMAGQLPRAAVPVVVMLLIVFGLKTAIFPLWYWLPETYHTLPAAIGGLFAGLLTKVGAYAMIRVFVMMFGKAVWLDASGNVIAYPVNDVVVPVLLVVAGITMFLGVLGAVSMHTVRRILSIHIISQVGYMVMGIGIAMAAGAHSQELALAGAIFFIIHNMVVKCCLFLCGGLMVEHAGDDHLDRIGGLLRRAPWLATLFLIAALSLAGLPPLSGFFGKFVLIREGFSGGFFLVSILAIATSLLTLLSMLKIWSYGFWSTPQGRHVTHPDERPRTAGGIGAIALLVVFAMSMGFGAQHYVGVTTAAARTIVDPSPYVRAVLGPQHVPVIQTAQRATQTHAQLATADKHAGGSR